MVGWSRRNAESDARRRRYRAWFDALPKSEQQKHLEAEKVQRRRERPRFITAIGLCFLVLAILLLHEVMTR